MWHVPACRDEQRSVSRLARTSATTEAGERDSDAMGQPTTFSEPAASISIGSNRHAVSVRRKQTTRAGAGGCCCGLVKPGFFGWNHNCSRQELRHYLPSCATTSRYAVNLSWPTAATATTS